MAIRCGNCIFVCYAAIHLIVLGGLRTSNATPYKILSKDAVISEVNLKTLDDTISGSHQIEKKDGVIDGDEIQLEQSEHNFETSFSLEELLALVLAGESSQNETSLIKNLSEQDVNASLALLADILVNSFPESQTDPEVQSIIQNADQLVELVHPQLQFLEPDLGPAVLPLHVPKGYFVPFVPRKAFGVPNGVARPAHGHASFYRHRPRGLVDVKNSPAFGFLFAGP